MGDAPPTVQPRRPAAPAFQPPRPAAPLAPRPAPQPRVAMGDAIVQQKKIPNLGSRVVARQAPRLVLQHQDDETYWLREEETNLPIRPSGLYNFVRVEPTGPIHLSKIDGHPALAEGQPVEYAGEMVFDDGRMRYWSNASGNYMPKADLHDQAGLPEDKFLTYDDVLRGKGRSRPDRREDQLGPAEQHAAAVEAGRLAATKSGTEAGLPKAAGPTKSAGPAKGGAPRKPR
jgi:hypothetical protein